ncbi:hypothetical protein PFISCL1PPCAC_19940, partial [Pristionchus fissidentatus]
LLHSMSDFDWSDGDVDEGGRREEDEEDIEVNSIRIDPSTSSDLSLQQIRWNLLIFVDFCYTIL